MCSGGLRNVRRHRGKKKVNEKQENEILFYVFIF